MTCRLRLLQNGELRTYNCDQVRYWQSSWKNDFKLKNNSCQMERIFVRDRYYEKFCEELDSFLMGCTCKNIL